MKYISIVLLLLIGFTAFAQNTDQPEMADVFRAEGKIYTVVAVLGIVLSGMFVYLFLTEKKLAKIEKELKAKSN